MAAISHIMDFTQPNQQYHLIPFVILFFFESTDKSR